MAKQRPGRGGKGGGGGGGGGKRGAKGGGGGGGGGGGKGWSDRAASDARVKKMERYEDTLEDGGVDDCEWCGVNVDVAPHKDKDEVSSSPCRHSSDGVRRARISPAAAAMPRGSITQ
jgi:hypothetical protein